MALAKIDKRKRLSKGRIGCTFVNAAGDPVSLPMGTTITDTTGNTFRVTVHRSDDGEFTPLLPLSGAKSPSENFEY